MITTRHVYSKHVHNRQINRDESVPIRNVSVPISTTESAKIHKENIENDFKCHADSSRMVAPVLFPLLL